MHKRVAILTNVLHPYRLPVLEELQRRCEKLAIFVSSGDATQEEAGSRSNLRVCRQKSWTVQTRWRHPHHFTEQLAIEIPYDTLLKLRQFQPDLIISGELGARTLLAAAYRRIRPTTRLVIWATLSEATEQGRGRVRPLLRRIVLRTADAVMVNGESGARYVQGLGVSPARIMRVPQTTNVFPFLSSDPTRSDPARHRLLYAGRLVELKGLQPFLRALSERSASQTERAVELWIVGDGPLGSALSTFAGPQNLEIRMLGPVGYDRLPEIYRQCGIFVFPSLADEWGMVVVEAMASGMPVLGSIHSQAVEELVSDGETGWRFNPNEPQEMQEAISQALAAPVGTLNVMGAVARQRVSPLTPAAMADQIEAALDYAIADRT